MASYWLPADNIVLRQRIIPGLFTPLYLLDMGCREPKKAMVEAGEYFFV